MHAQHSKSPHKVNRKSRSYEQRRDEVTFEHITAPLLRVINSCAQSYAARFVRENGGSE